MLISGLNFFNMIWKAPHLFWYVSGFLGENLPRNVQTKFCRQCLWISWLWGYAFFILNYLQVDCNWGEMEMCSIFGPLIHMWEQWVYKHSECCSPGPLWIGSGGQPHKHIPCGSVLSCRKEHFVFRNQECITIMTSKASATEALNTLVDALSYFRVWKPPGERARMISSKNFFRTENIQRCLEDIFKSTLFRVSNHLLLRYQIF